MSSVLAIPLDFPRFYGEFPESVVVIDLSTERIVYWNRAAERLFRFAESETADQPITSLTSKEASPKLAVALRQVVSTTANRSAADQFSFLASRNDLDPILVEATLSTLAGPSPEQQLVLAVIRETPMTTSRSTATFLLSAAADILLNSADWDVALSKVAQIAVPGLADFCSVFVLEEDLTIRHVTVAHCDPVYEQLALSLQSHYLPKIGGARGLIQTLLEGKPTIINKIDDSFFSTIAPDKRKRSLVQRLKIQSFMAVPLLAREHVVGVLTFSSKLTDRYRPSDLTFAEGLASITSLAIRGYRQYRAAQAALDQVSLAQKELVQNQKLRALGQMASGIAHDVNNGLSMILGLSDLLLNRSTEFTEADGPKDVLRMIQSTAEDTGQTVRGLREFYRPEEDDATKRRLDLSEVVDQVVRLTRPRWRDQALAHGVTIRVETYLADVPLLLAQDSDLRQALTNLIFNSVDALPGGGIIILRTRVEGDDIVVEVADTGEGMSEEVRRKCLEPYFTTKGADGSGLGLPMVLSFAERHGGRMSIESKPGHGTTVAIRLPFPRRHRKTGPVDGEPKSAERDLNLLFIGFSGTVRKKVIPALARDGHTIANANSGQEGLTAFARGKFDAVVLAADLAEPDASVVAAQIRAENPLIPLILVAKAEGDAGSVLAFRPPVDATVDRPVTLRGLRRALGQVGLM
ncbi:MAG TPA: ATP-binding protein [Chloroflexota bacterium]|nr:ATP-binding protein [Chloroflexota bacterium]